MASHRKKKSNNDNETLPPGHTIRIIVEIVIKHEQPPVVSTPLLQKNLNLGGGRGNRDFNFTFVPQEITVISLTIEDKKLQNPPNIGTITLDHVPVGEVEITATAVGQGNGTLQVVYLGSNLFDKPAEFDMEGDRGTIDETAKLP